MKRAHPLTTLIAAIGAAALAGCGASTTTEHPAVVGNASAQPTAQNQRAEPSPLRSNSANMLTQAWHIQTPANVTHMPLLDNGKLYFADWGGTVYCANPESGNILWQRQVQTPQELWPWHGFAGTGAIGDGKLFEASVEGDAYALDLNDGKTLWHVKITQDPNCGSLATLLYQDGKVFVGLSSVDEHMAPVTKEAGVPFKPSSRGAVMALDAKDGHTIWSKYLVEKPGNGVSVWSGFAFDKPSNMLFFTTGNNYTGQPSEMSDAIVAVNADSGEIQWHFQGTVNDVWTPTNSENGADYDFAAAPNLFEAGTRALVGAGSKNGRYYALDRRTGQRVWERQVAEAGIGGGIRATASVENGRIYLWSNNGFNDVQPVDPASKPMVVACLDATSGNVIWQRANAQPAGGTAAGILTNNVYFVGSLDGTVQAYRASDGRMLWKGQVPGGSIGSSINAAGSSIFFGTGVPKKFNGQDSAKGMFAYSPPRNVARAQ